MFRPRCAAARQLRGALEPECAVGRLAHADQQHALRSAVGTGEVEHLVLLAGECGTGKGAGDRAAEGSVEGGEGLGRGVALGAEHREGAGVQRRGISRADGVRDWHDAEGTRSDRQRVEPAPTPARGAAATQGGKVGRP